MATIVPDSSSTTPIPLIACGKHIEIARAAAKNVQPECEYVHVCLDVPSACTEIPAIYAGLTPPSNPNNVGTKNLAQPPAAIVFGGGFTDEEFDTVIAALEKSGKVTAPVLKFDPSKPGAPPLGPQYGIYVAARLKAKVRELEGEGRLGKWAVIEW